MQNLTNKLILYQTVKMKLVVVVLLALCVAIALAKKPNDNGNKGGNGKGNNGNKGGNKGNNGNKGGNKHKAGDQPTDEELLERRKDATGARSWYTCSDGWQIPDYWVCDLFDDCWDGADEQGCGGSNEYFICNDGYIIPGYWVCDDWYDCWGGEDEYGCSAPTTATTTTTTQAGPTTTTTQSSEPKSCGQTPIAPMGDIASIVGGATAVPYSWPWQVAFVSSSGFQFCGASVIDNEWVLTAAHCIDSDTISNPGSYGARIELFDKSNSGDGQTISLQAAIPHSGYNSNTMQNDIALLRLSSPITYSDKVQPVCLPSNDGSELNTGNKVTVTGWGTTSSGGSSSNTLQQVSVNMVSQSECYNQYGGIVESMMICGAAPGKDSCQGDSGGPLVRKTGGSWYQYGVVSFGNGCALEGYSGVYARVSNYCSWIQQITGKNLCS